MPVHLTDKFYTTVVSGHSAPSLAPSSSSVTARVAFHSILVATTEQLVHGLGYREGEVGLSRTLERESAVKQVAE